MSSNSSARITNWSSTVSSRPGTAPNCNAAWPNSADRPGTVTRTWTKCWRRPRMPPARHKCISSGARAGVRRDLLLDEPVISVHTQGDPRASLEEIGHVFPEVFSLQSNQRIGGSVSPIRRRPHVAHDGGMSSSEWLHFLVFVIKTGRALRQFLCHAGIVVPEAREIPELALGQVGLERVAVVKITPAGILHAQFRALRRAKALRVAAGLDARRPPHHAHFLVVPAEGIDAGPVAAVEMGVIHQQPLHLVHLPLSLQGRAHRRNALLVQDLVALDIDAPVARALAQGQVGVV